MSAIRGTECLVLDGDGEVLVRAPADWAFRWMNRLGGAACVVRESDGVVLASPVPIPAKTIAAWLAKLGHMAVMS